MLGSQESTVQGLLSLQAIGVPIQFPLLQTSSVVQASPSLQEFPVLPTITPLEHSSQGLKFSFESSIFPSQLLSIPSQTSLAFGFIASLVSSQSSEPINPSPSKSFWESEHPFSSTVSPLGVLAQVSISSLTPSLSESF